MAKFLWFSKFGDTLALAMRLAREGNEVDFYIATPKYKHVGDGLINKITDWRKALEPDKIIVFDMVGYGALADRLKNAGYKVFGGGLVHDKLELDRVYGSSIMKIAGIKIPPTTAFQDFDSAIKFVQYSNKRYVFKPSNNMSTALTYVSSNAQDMVHFLKGLKKQMHKIVEFELQEYIEGVEVSCEGLWVGDWVDGWCNITFERKRKGDNNTGVNTGCSLDVVKVLPQQRETPHFKKTLEKLTPFFKNTNYLGVIDINCIVFNGTPFGLEFTCFDEKTEVLTKNGWKYIKDVDLGEEVMTLNPQTDYLEYQKVIGTIKKYFKGELIHFTSGLTKKRTPNKDILVTPDHNMWVRPPQQKRFKFLRADQLNKHGYEIKITGKWTGQKREFFEIPEYIEKHYLGRYKKTLEIKHKAILIKMEDWLKFLGIYLAEGSLAHKKYIVSISQYSKKDQIREILKNLPFKFSETKHGFQISSIQLAKILNFGTASEKYVPSYVKELPPSQIKVFLDAYFLGDGCVHKKQRLYFTTSKRLADDLQELCLKCGISAHIKIRKSKNTSLTIKGKTYQRKHDLYIVAERKKQIGNWIQGRDIKKVPYEGKVYCLEVPNHLLLTRRNGFPAIVGNCRFGLNAIYTMLELVNEDLGKIISDACLGVLKEVKTNKDLFSASVRTFLPEKPYIPHRLIQNIENYKHVHLLDCMLDEEGNLVCADTDFQPAIITSTGITIQQASERVYHLLEKKLQRFGILDLEFRNDCGKEAEKFYQILQNQHLI